jgi:SecD/SecF fusion protein
MSEVIVRSLATSFCTLLPILALLFFGGETLKDFAFALMVGVASGAYSSIFIASPVLTHWKEREQGYRNRRARITREFGLVPAYATTAGGQMEDIEPEQKRKRGRRGRLTAPEDPNRELSHEEFQDLVRDLGVEEKSTPAPARAKRRSNASVAEQAPEQPRSAAPQRDPAADLTPEDLVLKDDAKPREKRRRPRNKRHGRSR